MRKGFDVVAIPLVARICVVFRVDVEDVSGQKSSPTTSGGVSGHEVAWRYPRHWERIAPKYFSCEATQNPRVGCIGVPVGLAAVCSALGQSPERHPAPEATRDPFAGVADQFFEPCRDETCLPERLCLPLVLFS